MEAVSPLAPIEPLLRLSGEACTALRARLAAIGYSPALLSSAESVAPGQLDVLRLPLVQRWLQRRGGAAAYVALMFEYASGVPRAAAIDALTAPLLSALEEAGVLRRRGEELFSTLRITPVEELFIVSDPYRSGTDAVMGPGVTTLDLVRAMPRAPGSVLDVGCGAGTLALVAAARGSPRAVGVDLNLRAVAFAALNARLNGLQAEFRAGDLLAPVAGERFDLVLCQPPYVIEPPSVERVTYLHGGPRGDELALRFAAAFPAALAPRGRALLLFDSAVTDTPLATRLRAVLGAAPVDLVVLLAPGPPADLQAVGYASVEDLTLGARYHAALRRYRDHLEAEGMTTFSRVLAILEPAQGPALDVQLPAAGLARLDATRLDALLSGLHLAAATTDEVLSSAVGLVAEGRLVEERRAGSLGGPAAHSVRFERGNLATDREISEAGAFLFTALEQAQSVRAAVGLFAQASGRDEAGVEQTVVDFVREGLSRALLVPRVSSPRSSTP